MQSILDKAKNGIDMNLLAFRTPDCVYYSNSCPEAPWRLQQTRECMATQSAQQTEILSNKQFTQFLAAVITQLINIINGRLNQRDCGLSMTDSTTAEGWMKKINLIKANVDPIQKPTRVDAARHYVKLFMDADVKGYSQWFLGKLNNVVDALLQDWHRCDKELTFILCSHFSK